MNVSRFNYECKIPINSPPNSPIFSIRSKLLYIIYPFLNFKKNVKFASDEDTDFVRMDLLDKFVYLMSNQQRNVMKYLSKAVPLRTECLYNSSG